MNPKTPAMIQTMASNEIIIAYVVLSAPVLIFPEA